MAKGKKSVPLKATPKKPPGLKIAKVGGITALAKGSGMLAKRTKQLGFGG